MISQEDPAKEGHSPLRTWVFRTDAQGKVKMTGAYQVGGDALYLVNGAGVLPVGTVTIRETKAPEGRKFESTTIRQSFL